MILREAKFTLVDFILRPTLPIKDNVGLSGINYRRYQIEIPSVVVAICKRNRRTVSFINFHHCC